MTTIVAIDLRPVHLACRPSRENWRRWAQPGHHDAAGRRHGGHDVRFGAVFPTTVVGPDAGAVRALATGVEELGFDHLIAYDHVLGASRADRDPPLAGPYDEHDEFHEVFVLFGHLAAVTTRLELTVGVLVAPMRPTVLTAKQAAEVQILSGGRLRLGVGTGWNRVEYEALGADFRRRGAVLDEQVALMRRLWTEPIVDVDGRHHRIDRGGLAPHPPPIPIWFGGYSMPAYRRSARSGEGHLFGHLDQRALDGAAAIAELRRGLGRTTADFGLEAMTDVTAPESPASAASRWRAVGGTHLSIRTMPTVGVPASGCSTVDEHLAAFEAWRDDLRRGGVWP
jgi:probable F420-dependent oxidoreductase